MTRGRLALHVISGGSDVEQKKDGDYLDHDGRYRRADEYLDVLTRLWASREPIDHHGESYRFEGAFSEIKPRQKPRPPIFFGGSLDAAIEVAGKHADTYMLWGEPLADVRDTIERVRASAARRGRTVRFSVSFRPILGATEEEAWWRARLIHRTILASSRPRGGPVRAQSVGSQRLLDAPSRGKVHDRCLWTAIAEATGARGSTTALVATPRSSDALLDYYKLGVETFLIRGFDPLNNAVRYGAELLPLVREKVARVDRATEIAARTAGPVAVGTGR